MSEDEFARTCWGAVVFVVVWCLMWHAMSHGTGNVSSNADMDALVRFVASGGASAMLIGPLFAEH